MSRDYIPVNLKRAVIARAKECCEYCCGQAKFALESFVIDHVTPVSRDGETVIENLALACHGCNNSKYNRVEGLDPLGKQLVPLYNPRTMKWNEHFAWSKDTMTILGLTPTGRATVKTLRVNRDSGMNLRRVLRITGQHPPF